MMMLVVSIAMDAVMAGLLIATIVFARRLSRQIAELREGRGALEALIRDFTEATEQADTSVAGMRRAAAESGETLQQTIRRGQTLKDEMEQIIQSADALANRLEHAAGQARGGQGAPVASGRPPETRPPSPVERAPRPMARDAAPSRPSAAPVDRGRDADDRGMKGRGMEGRGGEGRGMGDKGPGEGMSPRRVAAEIAGGGGLAARLVEAAVAASRPAAVSSAPPSAPASPSTSDVSRDPGLDVGSAPARAPRPTAPARPAPAAAPDAAAPSDGATAPEARSRAERDLLQALENMRQ